MPRSDCVRRHEAYGPPPPPPPQPSFQGFSHFLGGSPAHTHTHTHTHTHGRGQSVGHRRRRRRYVADKKRRQPLLIFVSCQLLFWRHLEIPAPSADCPENDAIPAEGKHSAIVFARCGCEEYGSTGNCLFMRDSLIEMVSQVQIVCVYRAVSLCYVTQTCVRINFMSSSLRFTKKWLTAMSW